MKISIAQLDFIIGDFEGNLSKIKGAIQDALIQQSDLICFSELSICGYPPRDFLEFDHFIESCKDAVDQLLELSHQIAIVIGAPVVNPIAEGKDLYNSALFIYGGQVQYTYHKTLLPTYDIFDEYRYFEPGKTFDVVEYKGYKIALTVCEDIWNIGNENPLYTISPLDEITKRHQPDFVLNLSASPFSYDHQENRKEILQANVARYKIPIFYVNQTGAQTEILFDGGSMVVNGQGVLVSELPYFESCVQTFDLDAILLESVSTSTETPSKIDLIHRALISGVRGYFDKLGLKQAILGLSGGIDSAVTAAIAVAALGADNVKGVLMPGPYSSDHSVEDAKSLAINLGMPYEIIPIQSVYDSYLDLLQPFWPEKPFDITEENIQARIRGMTLMALANKYGYIVLNTSNKTEAAVGYGTLYGDMCGGISVLGDLYKMQVYELANWINRDEMTIPVNSIQKPPSAELRPNQKDSDSLPDYDILDQILFQYIEKRKGPAAIIEMGYEESIVKRALKLVNMNEFKRYQTAPTLRVSPKAFGMGRRMPIVGKYLQ
jgi:NAD+ synthase (glutamine-hydrolysing)